nr:PREDICTED: uncharacterized protein LOC108202668 isoform X3 [Daucus carota subsp. sativus]
MCSRRGISQLLKYMEHEDLLMQSCMDGRELLVFLSTILQQILKRQRLSRGSKVIALAQKRYSVIFDLLNVAMDSHLLPIRKRRSTSEALQDGRRRRVTFADQISTICHYSGTEGSVSRLDFVDACGGGDVVPSPVSRTRTSNNSIGVQSQTASNHCSPKSGEGSKQTSVPTYLFPKNAPALERAWCGIMEVDGMKRLSVKMTAHLSAIVSRNAFELSKKMNPELHSQLLPRTKCHPDIFQESCPNRDDIALYFYPSRDERANGKYSELLRGMADNDLMMHAHIDGIELLMFPSTILTADSQTVNNSYFIWGLFYRRAMDQGTQESSGDLKR